MRVLWHKVRGHEVKPYYKHVPVGIRPAICQALGTVMMGFPVGVPDQIANVASWGYIKNGRYCVTCRKRV